MTRRPRKPPIGSPFNGSPAVVDSLAFPDEVYLVDSTIRSLQSGVSGSRHSLQDLVEIGVALAEVGVREQIINVSWRDGFEVIAALKERQVDSRLVATFRARSDEWKSWATQSAEAGADEVSLESLVDVDHLRELTGFIHGLGIDASQGFAEVYDYSELVALSREGVKLGLKSQSFHDSFFRLAISPEAIKEFIRSILADVPDAPPTYVHLSNFFGHATMTGVAALAAGATAVDVCANGTGHHCGHTSLAEVALALDGLYGVDCGIELSHLRQLAVLMEKHTAVPTPIMQPVVGEYAFVGDGAYWAVEEHLPYEERVHATFPVPPGLVNSEERIVWSDRTLSAEAVDAKLAQAGIQLAEADRSSLASELQEHLLQHKHYPHWLTDSEFIAFVSELSSSPGDLP